LDRNKVSFRLKSDIVIEIGLLKTFIQQVESLNFKKPLVLWDGNLKSSDYFNSIRPQLEEFSSKGVFTPINLEGEPSYELLSDLLTKLKVKKFDSIVSLGGGSLMDIGKGIALLATNDFEPKELKGFPVGLNDPLPHITIPSVLGSGAEASFNAVFIDEAEERKLGINSVNNFPKMVLVDPLLTLSAPKQVVVSSALDSMVHSVDSFGSRNSNSISRMFSIEAFRNIWTFLLDNDINSPEARLLLAKASILGIYGLMNSGDGPANGFAYYFGVKRKIAHGMAGGMFLKDVMKWNYKNGYFSYDQLIRDTSSKNMEQFFESFSQIQDLFSVPMLPDYGYNIGDCDALSKEVSSALTGSFSGNPITFDQQSAHWVLEQQFGVK